MVFWMDDNNFHMMGPRRRRHCVVVELADGIFLFFLSSSFL
jgi:hypothetical protein